MMDTRNSITFDDFIQICKNREWENFDLVSHLRLHLQILVSAIYDVYHPDEAEKKRNGLAIWNSRLQSGFVTEIDQVVFLQANLISFYKAYIVAISSKIKESSGLDDQRVADKIKEYVLEHQDQLAIILHNPKISTDLKKEILNCFGEITPIFSYEYKNNTWINTIKKSGSPVHSPMLTKNMLDNHHELKRNRIG